MGVVGGGGVVVVVVLVPSEQPDWEEERAGSPGPNSPGVLAGPRMGPAPGGCHGDAGSAAPRRGNKTVRPLLARAPPPPAPPSPPGRRRRRRRRSHTRCRGRPPGQVRRARPPPGVGGRRLEAGRQGGDRGVHPPQGAGLREGCAPAGHGLSARPPRNPGRRPRARRRAANFAAGAPAGQPVSSLDRVWGAGVTRASGVRGVGLCGGRRG